MSNTTRTLIVLTGDDAVSEIAHVYNTFVRAGLAVDFVSPTGGTVLLESLDRNSASNASFLDDHATTKRLHVSLRPDEVDAANYGAIYYPGGHDTLRDLRNNGELANLAAAIYEAGGIVAAICHSSDGLVVRSVIPPRASSRTLSSAAA